MNKVVATTLESKVKVFDLRTQHSKEGFPHLTEKVWILAFNFFPFFPTNTWMADPIMCGIFLVSNFRLISQQCGYAATCLRIEKSL